MRLTVCLSSSERIEGMVVRCLAGYKIVGMCFDGRVPRSLVGYLPNR